MVQYWWVHPFPRGWSKPFGLWSLGVIRRPHGTLLKTKHRPYTRYAGVTYMVTIGLSVSASFSSSVALVHRTCYMSTVHFSFLLEVCIIMQFCWSSVFQVFLKLCYNHLFCYLFCPLNKSLHARHHVHWVGEQVKRIWSRYHTILYLYVFTNELFKLLFVMCG